MRKIFITILIIAIAAFIVVPIFAQKKSAIGVRIMPNSEHLPVQIWYENQRFKSKGSPIPIQTDGYDGIKDGNTVYVNAMNILHPEILNPFFCKKDNSVFALNNEGECDSGGTKKENFYTNIYVISYTEDDEINQNIFDQIINNWKFNSNINLHTPCPGCSSGKLYAGQAEVDAARAAIRRDSRRLADMAYMHWVFKKYYEAYGYYPKLNAGTYIQTETLSKWSSWQETLGADLGITIPVDPVNSFGICDESNPDCYCDGYDEQTCWNEKTRLFNGQKNINAGLPQTSLVYYYKSYSNGASYEFNAKNWETAYIGGEYIFSMQAVYSAGNIKPVIQIMPAVEISLGETKIVEARAYDYNKFTGKIIWVAPLINGTDCISAAVLEPNVQNADKFYGDKFISYKNLKITAGNRICSGTINLKVFDDGIKNLTNSAMESEVYAVSIAVKDQAPRFSGTGNTYTATTVVGYNWEGYFIKAEDIEYNILTYEISNNRPSWVHFDGLAETVNIKESSAGIKILGKPNVSTDVTTHIFSIKAKDLEGGIAEKNIELTVTNATPIISLSPANSIKKHIKENFSYDVKASDADGHSLTYSMTCDKDNGGTILIIDSATGEIKSPDNFTAADYGAYKFTVAVNDGYGGVASKIFELKIVPFCGNKEVESWADGGIIEQCESAGNGLNGSQYGCTNCKWSGGYCGDGIAQNGTNNTVNKEICDGNSIPCSVTNYSGLPFYCASISIIGTKSCKSDCTDWNSTCVANPPVPIASTSTGCNTTSIKETATCCELVSCVNDGCRCCGRKKGVAYGDPLLEPDNQWKSLEETGYTSKQSMSPCSGKNGNNCKWTRPDGPIGYVCEYGESGCTESPPICNETNDTNASCKLLQGDNIKSNWYIKTNHTTAYYQCWK
ncbi:MAG: putative Ig domain-containing protein [bacterium]